MTGQTISHHRIVGKLDGVGTGAVPKPDPLCDFLLKAFGPIWNQGSIP